MKNFETKSRQRMVAIIKILLTESSEDNPLSVSDFEERMADEFGLFVDRKPIYDDLKAIRQRFPVHRVGAGRSKQPYRFYIARRKRNEEGNADH